VRLARYCLIGSLAICCSVAIAPRISQAQASRVRDAQSILKESRDRHFRDFANQMEKLAQSCEDKNMNEAAELVRSRVIDIEPQSHNLRTLPKEVTPDIPNNLPDGERFWRTQLRALEKRECLARRVWLAAQATSGSLYERGTLLQESLGLGGKRTRTAT
jgi:hypothetical protein